MYDDTRDRPIFKGRLLKHCFKKPSYNHVVWLKAPLQKLGMLIITLLIFIVEKSIGILNI